MEVEVVYEDVICLYMQQFLGNGELGIIIMEGEIDVYIVVNLLNGLGDLINQKYIVGFLFSVFESYNDYCCIGFFVDIQFVLNVDYLMIFICMIYIDMEVNNNVVNVLAGIILELKVWWDGD